MARFAKKPIEIPKGVEIKMTGTCLAAKGPKGQLTYTIPEQLVVEQKEGVLTVRPKLEAADIKKLDNRSAKFLEMVWGTTRAKLASIVEGVLKGFERKLSLVGVGYRAQMQGNQTLNLSLGFSHPVNYSIPKGISIQMPSQTEIIIQGVDSGLVGQVAADIRAIRSVEPYKGKGVRYSDETVILKETKKK